MYNYKVELIKVVDGDTVDLKVDLGFKLFMHERFRLTGINAPEMRGAEKEAGKAAKEFLIDLLKNRNNKDIVIQTEKQGKYGRWLAIIKVGDSTVNHVMVATGHAVYKDY